MTAQPPKSHNHAVDNETTTVPETKPDQPETAPARTPCGNVAAAQFGAWAKEADRALVASKPWEPGQLWAQWRRYCAEQDAKSPPSSCIIPEFSLQLGCTSPELAAWAERGKEWSAVCKKIETDCAARIEKKLLSGGHSQIACIFWLKNRAGWRDKSPEEAKDDREDWLARVTANAAAAGRSGRAGAPPVLEDSAQLPEFEDDPQEPGFPPSRLITRNSA